jgi:uncharacterized protein
MYELELVGPEGQVRHIHYEPHFNEMYWDDGEKFQVNQFRFAQDMNWEAATIVSPDMPGKKSRDAKVIKIQLGLKCNYACSYCNQAAQPHDYDGSPKEVDAFFDKFQTWFNLGDGEGKRIEFWGGEPFVYWKTLKPLAEKVRAAYPKAEFNIITNASLFDKDKVDWLVSLGFQVGISHDGPGYEENRGQDPLKDKDILPWVKYAYDQLHPSGKIGFNCVLTGRHYSIKEVKEYIGHHLGVAPEDVPVTTEEILLAYDDNAVSVGLQDEMDAAMLMHTVFYEGITGVAMPSLAGKIKDFLTSVTNHRPSYVLGQKCGMDRQDNVAVDMGGNVLTCQNTSSETRHKLGNMDDLDAVSVNTVHHWSTRKECPQCPVLQLCQGACMFLEDALWEKACDNSFAYNLALLAIGLFHSTNMVLVKVKNPAGIRFESSTEVSVIDPSIMHNQGKAAWMKKRPKVVMLKQESCGA